MGQLELGPNIACNEALRENVFMMVVCIELRIPLFVVGKSGSSNHWPRQLLQTICWEEDPNITFSNILSRYDRSK